MPDLEPVVIILSVAVYESNKARTTYNLAVYESNKARTTYDLG